VKVEKNAKNERGIPGIPQLQLQRKQRMVKGLATQLSSSCAL